MKPLAVLCLVCFYICCNPLREEPIFTVDKERIVLKNREFEHFVDEDEKPKVFVWDEKNQTKLNNTPILGKLLATKEGTVQFVPLFPFKENTDYLLVLKNERKKYEKLFRLPKAKTSPPKIEAFFPSADTLPENLLRVYLHFSKPMKTVGNLENIQLIDENGKEVKGAIFNNTQELWNAKQKQLTLIFDPSRVKTGLKANQLMGRALQRGKRYTMVVLQAQDTEGQQLEAPFIKSFYVSTADKQAPNMSRWQLKIPHAKSCDPLILEFPEMLDQLSMLTRLQLSTTQGNWIAGKTESGNHQKNWRFTPKNPWEKGAYYLKVNTRLEDPAGNNLNGLFDHKIGSLKNEKEGITEQLIFEITE